MCIRDSNYCEHYDGKSFTEYCEWDESQALYYIFTSQYGVQATLDYYDLILDEQEEHVFISIGDTTTEALHKAGVKDVIQVCLLYTSPGTACYRCFFKEPPPAGAVPTCSQAGVLGAIAGMLGTIQAAEALKYLLGVGELLTDRLLTFDAKTMNFRTIKAVSYTHLR